VLTGADTPAQTSRITDPDDDLDQVLALDLNDPHLYATERPERIWRTMRRTGVPLHLSGARSHWAVTRYEQIKEVLRHSSLLSSEKGMRLGEKATDSAAGATAGGTSILVTDDPAHARMRRILEPAFAPRVVRRLAESTGALAHRLVSEAAAQPSVDFVESVAGPLLTTVACDLVGVPVPDRAHVAELCQTAFSGAGYATATAQITAHVELLEYCAQLIAGKRRAPGDDAATILAQAKIDGAPLRREAAIMNCHDLLLGGNASARYVLTSMPVTLLTQRRFWSQLHAGTADFAAATQELLRYENPANHIMRALLGDLEIEGMRMRRGELVTLWLRSGNRDEDVFDGADEMRLGVPRRAHLSFGAGPHYCIAANLARMEIESLLRALASLVGDAELTAVPVRMESSLLRGYRSVPIALRRR
jgi:cytochrome P450